jgi:hypothetical protein
MTVLLSIRRRDARSDAKPRVSLMKAIVGQVDVLRGMSESFTLHVFREQRAGPLTIIIKGGSALARALHS